MAGKIRAWDLIYMVVFHGRIPTSQHETKQLQKQTSCTGKFLAMAKEGHANTWIGLG
jgi:hypothetical protein